MENYVDITYGAKLDREHILGTGKISDKAEQNYPEECGCRLHGISQDISELDVQKPIPDHSRRLSFGAFSGGFGRLPCNGP